METQYNVFSYVPVIWSCLQWAKSFALLLHIHVVWLPLLLVAENKSEGVSYGIVYDLQL